MNMLRKYYVNEMELAEDKFIELMKQEVVKTVYGGAPGKSSWREETSQMLRETYREIADDYIELGAGIGDTLLGTCKGLFVRAMLISEGSGSAAGGSPITAGPTGRNVWDSELDSTKPSDALSVYTLPDKFNQSGNHFIENAAKEMRKSFIDILSSASAALPSNIFFENVIVSGGG